jgi:hypothetical protein
MLYRIFMETRICNRGPHTIYRQLATIEATDAAHALCSDSRALPAWGQNEERIIRDDCRGGAYYEFPGGGRILAAYPARRRGDLLIRTRPNRLPDAVWCVLDVRKGVAHV